MAAMRAVTIVCLSLAISLASSTSAQHCLPNEVGPHLATLSTRLVSRTLSTLTMLVNAYVDHRAPRRTLAVSNAVL